MKPTDPKCSTLGITQEVVFQSCRDIGPAVVKQRVESTVGVVKNHAVFDRNQAQTLCQSHAKLHREQLDRAAGCHASADDVGNPVRQEDGSQFRHVSRVFEEHEVDHGTDEIIEATIAMLDQAA